MAVTDDSIMLFGKYKGRKLSEIPNGWWETLYRAGKLSGQYKAYAEETVPILRFEKEKAEKRKSPE